MRQAIKQGRRHPLSLEDLLPFAEWKVRGDQQARSLVAIREDLEQQLGAGAIERQIPKLVADQQVDFIQLLQKPIELVLLLGFFQTVH